MACFGFLAALAVVIEPSALFLAALVIDTPGLGVFGMLLIGVAVLSAWSWVAAVQTVRRAIDAPPKPTAAARTVAK